MDNQNVLPLIIFHLSYFYTGTSNNHQAWLLTSGGCIFFGMGSCKYLGVNQANEETNKTTLEIRILQFFKGRQKD